MSNKITLDKLDVFYDDLKSGLRVDEFLTRCDEVMTFRHEVGLTEDYRLGRGRVKGLQSEIRPMARYAAKNVEPDAKIQFPLDDGPVDCNLIYSDPTQNKTIEITLCQARENLNLMNELNDKGQARGFIGIGDDKPKIDFDKAMSQEQKAHSKDEVRDAVVRAVELCAENKMYSQADVLAIGYAPSTFVLPEDRLCHEMKTDLSKRVENLPFSDVYFVGGSGKGDICMKLK